MNNNIFDIHEIVYVPSIDLYGKIIDVYVDNDDQTRYTIVFDNGTWNSFLGKDIKGDGVHVL